MAGMETGATDDRFGETIMIDHGVDGTTPWSAVRRTAGGDGWQGLQSQESLQFSTVQSMAQRQE